MKAMNDKSTKGQKITLEKKGRTLTPLQALIRNTNVPCPLEREVRKEERERKMGQGPVHDAMKEDLTMTKLRRAIEKLNKMAKPNRYIFQISSQCHQNS